MGENTEWRTFDSNALNPEVVEWVEKEIAAFTDAYIELPENLKFWVLDGEAKWSKRLRKWLFKEGYSVPEYNLDPLVDRVADWALQPSMPMEFRFQERIDWGPGDFGDGNSCFWGEKADNRLALNDCFEAGAVVVRYRDSGDPVARALVFQDPEDNNAIILFNGYTRSYVDLGRMANAIAVDRGQRTSEVSIDADFWVNRDEGIRISDGGNGGHVSLTARVDDYAICNDCHDASHIDYMVLIPDWFLCEGCALDYEACDDCREMVYAPEMILVEGDRLVCEICIGEYSRCDACDLFFSNGNRMSDVAVNGAPIGRMCDDCRDDIQTRTEQACDFLAKKVISTDADIRRAADRLTDYIRALSAQGVRYDEENLYHRQSVESMTINAMISMRNWLRDIINTAMTFEVDRDLSGLQVARGRLDEYQPVRVSRFHEIHESVPMQNVSTAFHALACGFYEAKKFYADSLAMLSGESYAYVEHYFENRSDDVLYGLRVMIEAARRDKLFVPALTFAQELLEQAYRDGEACYEGGDIKVVCMYGGSEYAVSSLINDVLLSVGNKYRVMDSIATRLAERNVVPETALA